MIKYKCNINVISCHAATSHSSYHAIHVQYSWKDFKILCWLNSLIANQFSGIRSSVNLVTVS